MPFNPLKQTYMSKQPEQIAERWKPQNQCYYWVRENLISDWMPAQFVNGQWYLFGGSDSFSESHFGIVEKQPITRAALTEQGGEREGALNAISWAKDRVALCASANEAWHKLDNEMEEYLNNL